MKYTAQHCCQALSIIVLLNILACMALCKLYAQSRPEPDRVYRWYIEVEPLQFINNGFSVVGHYAANPHIQIGTNVFSSTLSSDFRDLAFNLNGDSDPEARQQLGVNLSFRYFLRENHRGWVFSMPVGYEWWEMRSTTRDMKTRYEFAYVSPRIGYQFIFFETRFTCCRK